MFGKDLIEGHKAEDYILQLIHKKYPKAYRSEGNEKRWDIAIPEVKKLVEVKYDRKSKDTGHVAIEYSYYGKPSGISATKSHIFVIIYFNKKWKTVFLKTDDIKFYLKNFEYHKTSGGDNEASKMFLIPTSEIDNWKLIDDYERYLESSESSS